MYKLSPDIGPVKWRYGVELRFQFNAQRCRKIVQGLTDPEERAYTLNLAELWEQLAEAARFRQESVLSDARTRPRNDPRR